MSYKLLSEKKIRKTRTNRNSKYIGYLSKMHPKTVKINILLIPFKQAKNAKSSIKHTKSCWKDIVQCLSQDSLKLDNRLAAGIVDVKTPNTRKKSNAEYYKGMREQKQGYFKRDKPYKTAKNSTCHDVSAHFKSKFVQWSMVNF